MFQCRIWRDKNKLDSNGVPQSCRFGFVAFSEHSDALAALKSLNNNPETFTKEKVGDSFKNIDIFLFYIANRDLIGSFYYQHGIPFLESLRNRGVSSILFALFLSRNNSLRLVHTSFLISSFVIVVFLQFLQSFFKTLQCYFISEANSRIFYRKFSSLAFTCFTSKQKPEEIR